MRPTASGAAIGLSIAFLTACSSDQDPSTHVPSAGAPAMPAGGTGATSGAGGVSATGGTAGAVASGGAGGSSGATTTGGTAGAGGPSAAGTAGAPAGGNGGGGLETGGTAGSGTAGEGSGGSSAGGGGTAGGGAGGSAGSGAGAGGSGGDGGTGGMSPSGPMPEVYDVENTGADCPVATTFPAFNALPSIPEFPDPFLKESGGRITSRADWRCRRAEIAAQIQRRELGTKPPPDAGQVTASFSNNRLTVNVTVGGKMITLTTTITLPSGGTPPYPAVIRMAGSGVPIQGQVASMNFADGQLASQFPTRGSGPFWDLFPDNTAGAYAGWAWGVSRIIDGLQLTAAENKIDTRRLAVTGCSYAGKMALWAGAFDERIALTIPQESGGGGEASWRFMAGQPETENLEEAQGTGWYSSRLLDFGNADAPKLPFDQHSLVAMVAPRAILAIHNTAIARLGSQAGGASMKAAAKVYEALGVPERLGFSQAAASGHCQFPSSQGPDVNAFVQRFLMGDASTDTNIRKDSYANTDMSKWVPWSTPALN